MYSDAHYESYYGVSVITPRSDVIHQLRLERETFTRKIIDVGSYSDKKIINETIKQVYAFFRRLLKGLFEKGYEYKYIVLFVGSIYTNVAN